VSSRARRSVHLDLRTGEATMTTELLPDAPLADRVEQMKADGLAALEGGGPLLGAEAALTCDGCGLTVALDFWNPQLPEGWSDGEDGDFCPGCSANG
jgi:hypothetical protein